MKKSLLFTLIISIIFIISFCTIAAQRNIAKGTEFLLTGINHGGGYNKISFISEKDTKGTIYSIGIDNKIDIDIKKTYSSSKITFFEPDSNYYLTDWRNDNFKILKKGILIKTEDPVIIIMELKHIDGLIGPEHINDDKTIIFPTNVLGTVYVVSNFNDNFLVDTISNYHDSYFCIIAKEDNTQININPRLNYKNGKTIFENPFKITLNRGQTYLYSKSPDLSGTIIKSQNSSKPFAVISGTYRFQSDNCKNSDQLNWTESLIEQLLPLEYLGYEYLALIDTTSINGDLLRLSAIEDSTNIRINNENNICLNSSMIYDTIVKEPIFMKSNKKISVMQLITQKTNGHYVGKYSSNCGAAMVNLVPLDRHFIANQLIELLEGAEDNYYEYIGIITKTQNIPSVKLDTIFLKNQFRTLRNFPEYSYATIQLFRDELNRGSFLLRSDSSLFSYQFGFDKIGSVQEHGVFFAFSNGIGGHFIEMDFVPKTKACIGNCITFRGKGEDRIKFWEWDFGDGSKDTGKTVTYTYNQAGKYTITLTAKQVSSDIEPVDVIVDEITILPEIKPEIISDKTTICIGEKVTLQTIDNYKSYKWSTGETKDKITIDRAGIYTVVVTDSNGCTGTDSIEIKELPNLQPEISLIGNQPLCQGDSAKLTIVESYDKYLWSTTETTKEITVKSSGKYWVSVENQSGCKGSDTIEVIMHSNPSAKINASGPITFCEGSTVWLIASQDGLKYWWTTGDTTRQILVDSAGTYYLNVENEFGCKNNDSIKISTYPKPDVKITGITRFCEGDSTKLSCDGDFASYKWSNNETTKEIWVKEEGKYSVTVIDSNGCSTSAEIEVSKIVVRLGGLGLGFRDWGIIKIDSTADTTINIVNINEESITISARLLNGDGFSLDTQPQSPANMDKNSIFSIKVIFTPKDEKEYNDSLIIEISSPCFKRYAIYLHGSGFKDIVAPIPVTVWFPDTVGKVGDKNFRIPLYSVGRNKIPCYNIPYTATIRWNVTLFLADSITNGKITANDLINKEQILKIEGDNFTLSQDTTIITQIIGSVLLGDTLITPLLIDSIDIKYPNLQIEKKPGSLKIEGVCQPIFSRIKTMVPPDIQVFPNPSGSTITITAKLGNSSDLNISISNSIGGKKMEYNEKAGAGQFKKEINLESLPTGKYFVNITINGDTWCWGVVKE